MTEIEKAYATLELKPDATAEDAGRARRRLVAAWDPDRLPQYSGLRQKAESKIQEVEAAYALVIQHLDPSGEQSVTTVPRQSEVSGPAPVAPGTDQGTASLFDEMFSSELHPGRRRFPVLPAIIGLATLLLVAVYLSQGDSTSSGQAVAPNSPLEQELANVPPPEPAAESASIQVPPGEAATRATQQPKPSAPSRSQTKPRRPEAAPRTPEARTQPQNRPPQRPTAATPPQPRQAASDPSHQTATPAATSSAAEIPPPPAPAPKPEEEPKSLASDSPADLEKAFIALLENSSAARKLTTGAVSGFRYQEYRLVQRKGPEVWLDLLAHGPGGVTAHFIWSVNLEDSKVVALSQAARNLGKP